MSEAAKVLVLGAGGFFGNWICRELESEGFEVLSSTRESGGDLLDPDSLRRLIAETRPGAVVNAAGQTSPAGANQDPANCFAVNTGGVLNLLEAIRRESPETRLIAFSSAVVYAGDPPFREGTVTGAISPYAASKLAMEIICGQFSRGYGLPITVLRCFNLIGPGEPETQATSEFSLAALRSGKARKVEISVGEPTTARDFTDIRDAARAVRMILEADVDGTFNLCSGNATTLEDLADVIGSISGTEVTLKGTRSGRPASGLLTVKGDCSRLENATGWTPEITLEQSLTDLLASLRP